MAGKKKVQDDTLLSKTARASKGKAKQEGFIPAAPEHMNRIIPLAGGEYAYVLDPRDGKTHHLRVYSERWAALMVDLEAAGHGARIQAELEKLGWENAVR